MGTCVCDKYIHKFIKVATFISQVRILLRTSYIYTIGVAQPQLQNAHQATLLLEKIKLQRRYPGSRLLGPGWICRIVSVNVCGWGKAGGTWSHRGGAFLAWTV